MKNRLLVWAYAAFKLAIVAVLAAAWWNGHHMSMLPVAPLPPALADESKPPRFSFYGFGLASWYGYPEHGRKTASGQLFDMDQLTAAHPDACGKNPKLPWGSRLSVRNRRNNREVVVTVNDCMPPLWRKQGRVIDLSRAAARQLDMERDGLAEVDLCLLVPE